MVDRGHGETTKISIDSKTTDSLTETVADPSPALTALAKRKLPTPKGVTCPQNATNSRGWFLFTAASNDERLYRELIARATRTSTVASEITDWIIVRTFAQRDRIGTSVGENAVLVLNERNR